MINYYTINYIIYNNYIIYLIILIIHFILHLNSEIKDIITFEYETRKDISNKLSYPVKQLIASEVGVYIINHYWCRHHHLEYHLHRHHYHYHLQHYPLQHYHLQHYHLQLYHIYQNYLLIITCLNELILKFLV